MVSYLVSIFSRRNLFFFFCFFFSQPVSPMACSLLCVIYCSILPLYIVSFVEHGADITATNNEGYTALSLAVSLGNKNGKFSELSFCCIRVSAYFWNVGKPSTALFDQSHFLIMKLTQYLPRLSCIYSIQGPVTRGMVSANHWFRTIETCTFLW